MSKGYLYDNGDELISREEALPSTGSASSGDVLSLDSEKKPVWSAPSGGGDSVIYGSIVPSGSGLRLMFFSDSTGINIMTIGDVVEAIELGAKISTKTGLYVTDVMSHEGTTLYVGSMGDISTQTLMVYYIPLFIIDTSDLTATFMNVDLEEYPAYKNEVSAVETE